MTVRIIDQWVSFAEQAIPSDASPTQFREMKIAFYAGVEGLNRIQAAVISGGYDEDKEVQLLEDVEQELLKFARSLAVDQKAR